MIKFEPLIVHLFKLFARVHDLKRKKANIQPQYLTKVSLFSQPRIMMDRMKIWQAIKTRPKIADPTHLQNLPDQKSYDIFNLIELVMISIYHHLSPTDSFQATYSW